jgi:uncharacterized protein with FMN-binding domain
MRSELKQLESVAVTDVNLSAIPPGSYTGSYVLGKFTYSVRCKITEGGRIDKIIVLQNRSTHYAKMAEGVIPRVIEQQKINVDAVSGATAGSKALLKAIERALTKNASVNQ